jgi:hypothetical protein
VSHDHRSSSATICLVTVGCAGALLCFATTYAQEPPSDWLIVPGERVGPITATTSEAMLETLFGARHVEQVDVYLGEGFTEPGAVVYPGTPMRKIEIVWRDTARAGVKEVRLTGDSSIWETAEGISLGSTLKEIERLNGYPFRLLGFDWDYGGTITDCGRGRLDMVGCADRDGVSQEPSVVLRLRPSVEGRERRELRQVLGDREFSSGHPAMQALDPGVYQMIVYL